MTIDLTLHRKEEIVQNPIDNIQYDDPFKWSPARKWTITVVLALCTLSATLCSSIFSATIEVTAVEFETTETVMLLGVSLFVLGTSMIAAVCP